MHVRFREVAIDLLRQSHRVVRIPRAGDGGSSPRLHPLQSYGMTNVTTKDTKTFLPRSARRSRRAVRLRACKAGPHRVTRAASGGHSDRTDSSWPRRRCFELAFRDLRGL